VIRSSIGSVKYRIGGLKYSVPNKTIATSLFSLFSNYFRSPPKSSTACSTMTSPAHQFYQSHIFSSPTSYMITSSSYHVGYRIRCHLPLSYESYFGRLGTIAPRATRRRVSLISRGRRWPIKPTHLSRFTILSRWAPALLSQPTVITFPIPWNYGLKLSKS
jgi:hypothetical protein